MVPINGPEGEQEQTKARPLAPARAQHGKEPKGPLGQPMRAGCRSPRDARERYRSSHFHCRKRLKYKLSR